MQIVDASRLNFFHIGGLKQLSAGVFPCFAADLKEC